MNEAVLDASTASSGSGAMREADVGAAGSLGTRFEAGKLSVLDPPLVRLEILNVAAPRWGLSERS
jgi:hypothetical protein